MEDAHDDRAGLARSYFALGRSDTSQALANSALFAIMVTAVLTGLLPATGLLALGAAPAVSIVVGVVVAVTSAVLVALLEGRRVRALLARWTPIRPTPAATMKDPDAIR